MVSTSQRCANQPVKLHAAYTWFYLNPGFSQENHFSNPWHDSVCHFNDDDNDDDEDDGCLSS